MSHTYKITLKPTGAFYFGGEDSFSSAPLDAVVNDDPKAKEYFKKRQGYFAKSEMFPQQSQLLGMIHKELYRQNGLLLYFKNFVRVPQNKEDSEKMNKIKNSIISLSPLLIENEDSLSVPTPFDNEITLVGKKDSIAYINGRKTESAFAFQKCDGGFFGAKDYLSSSFVSTQKEYRSIDKLFKSVTQTQTQTLDYKQDDDEQFFKVQKYYLDKDYKFVIYLTMDTDEFVKEGSYTVELGGERSYFAMHIQKATIPSLQEEFSFLAKEQARIVLLSDSYVDANIFEKCHVTLAQKRIVRTMKHTKDNGFKKSTKEVYLSRGSVLFPRDSNQAKAIIAELRKHIKERKLGYNHYLDSTQGENYEPKTI